jgi:APA family basic amino acid/polyamine antiporter
MTWSSKSEPSKPVAPGGTKVVMKRTLNLTSLTVNAMALIAPGAFLWTTLQMQAAQLNKGVTTATEMWTGLVAALVLAFLTAISYSELSNIYPKAGSGSSYYFAEAALLEKEKVQHRQFARLAKFVVGWVSHLYYWIYPGIMVAFSATLLVYIFGLFGVALAMWVQVGIAVLFAGLTGYIAYRGINGSTMTALAINAIQLAALVAFAVMAIVFRHTHATLAFAMSPSTIVIPHNLMNMVYQSTIAILLLVGFESVTAYGAEAIRPKKDIRKAILLSLLIQGLLAYLLEYFAAAYVVGGQLTAVDASGATVTGFAALAASGAPLGELMRMIGNALIPGSGTVLAGVLAVTVVVALIGTTLSCLNTGVRITYAMSKDREMPSALGLLHGRFATPTYGIWILVAVSAVLGAYGVLSVNNLSQITLASNTGTFIVYGLTNLICLIAFLGRPGARFMQHRLIPVLGFVANLIMLLAIIYLSVSAGGATQANAAIAIAMVVVWLAAGAAWFILNGRRTGQAVLVRQVPVLTDAQKEEG